ncbi:beta-ketoacyl synthase N-terminal-like domain-containing protein [Streptosporangium jomthongense]|uniref:Beta-ketoacyl synthase N-terminal-like domain-containing protein n=1 Tax=Streptosporangium jomthongense TaxID=1193683 RepID=A0ABV8F8W8_9ACTN
MTVITGVGTAIGGVARPADLLLTTTTPGGEDPITGLSGRGLRYKDRATKLALCAGRDALTDAGLLLDPGLAVPGESIGVVVSSNFGNVDTVCATVSTIAEHGYGATSPMMLPATASNVTASWLAISFGLRGVNLTLCNGPTSGLDAVYWAGMMIDAGRARRMLVVGVEPVNEVVTHLVGPLFDGAAALVLESEEAARERGAGSLARLGRYARRETHDEAVGHVLEQAGPVGLWCLPEQPPTTEETAGAATHDLTALLGRCSGALGVVQCVAGASWLSAGGDGAVLASVNASDAAAATVLTPAPTTAGTGR